MSGYSSAIYEEVSKEVDKNTSYSASHPVSAKANTSEGKNSSVKDGKKCNTYVTMYRHKAVNIYEYFLPIVSFF